MRGLFTPATLSGHSWISSRCWAHAAPRRRKGHTPLPRLFADAYFVTLSGATAFGASVGAVCRCRCERNRLVADATFSGFFAVAPLTGVASMRICSPACRPLLIRAASAASSTPSPTPARRSPGLFPSSPERWSSAAAASSPTCCRIRWRRPRWWACERIYLDLSLVPGRRRHASTGRRPTALALTQDPSTSCPAMSPGSPGLTTTVCGHRDALPAAPALPTPRASRSTRRGQSPPPRASRGVASQGDPPSAGAQRPDGRARLRASC